MRIVTAVIASLLCGQAAVAQVPPQIAAPLRQIGPVVDPAATAVLYRPLQAKPPYTGAVAVRDVAYGTNQRQLLDVFTYRAPLTAPPVPNPLAPPPRPVLIYVSGGAGNKIEPVPNGDAFYDNIMLWAVANGMIGVNVQRLSGQGRNWDDPAKDIGLVLAWVRENIVRYSGDPARVFIWAHSAGNGPVATYLAHPGTQGANGHGLKGAILMGGVFDIQPNPAPDGHSNLPGLQKTDVPLFLAAGELDLPAAVSFVDTLKTALCEAKRCPTTAVFKDHSHMSSVFSPNTDDTSVTGPILAWMQAVK